jgi:hypothetical protein
VPRHFQRARSGAICVAALRAMSWGVPGFGAALRRAARLSHALTRRPALQRMRR